jgi:methyl-accepting chemotaxis protein
VGYLSLRRTEKDYFLRFEESLIPVFDKRIDELKTGLAQSIRLTDLQRNGAQKALLTYSEAFTGWRLVHMAWVSNVKKASSAYDNLNLTLQDLRTSVEAVTGAAKKSYESEIERGWLVNRIVFAILLSTLALLGFLVARSISRPLVAIAGHMKALASGNLDITINGTKRRDEVGAMTSALVTFKAALQERDVLAAESAERQKAMQTERQKMAHALAEGFEAMIGGIVENVGNQAIDMERAATSLAGTADQGRNAVEAIAGSIEEAASSAHSVATSTEEMAAGIREVTGRVSASSSYAAEAVNAVDVASAGIRSLQSASQQIGNVVDVISTIANQTNLLALNATIEAARAGEAGRGFAVVAQEVKTLATQTAEATRSISVQIADMQSATNASVESLAKIEETVNFLARNTSDIAASIEQQNMATQQIARSIQGTAEGTERVSRDIQNIGKGASETGAAADQMLSSARALQSNSNQLSEEVRKFLNSMRAA